MPSGHAGIAAYRPVANDRSCVKTLKLGFLVQCRGSPTPNEDIAALQQQLKGARTRIHNLTVEKNAAWRARDEARDANPVTITKANLRKLQKVFHPDPEHDTATPERKQQLREAAQTFNAIKFNVPGRNEKPKPSR
jgi:hypothetical protein